MGDATESCVILTSDQLFFKQPITELSMRLFPDTTACFGDIRVDYVLEFLELFYHKNA